MRLTASINGLDKVLADFDQLKGKLSDLTPVFKGAKGIIMASVDRNFQEGGRPRWKPLSPETLLRRARGKKGSREHSSGPNKGRVTAVSAGKYLFGAKSLLDTGILMTSVGRDVSRITRTSLTIGTNVPYAAAQNFGFEQVPARPFMVLQPMDEEKIVRLFLEHIGGPA